MDSSHRCVVATAKRTDVYAFDVIQSKLSRRKNRPSSTESIADRAVAAASWLGAAKASQAGRSLRTTLSGISSLALGHSGPPIGGISSWHIFRCCINNVFPTVRRKLFIPYVSDNVGDFSNAAIFRLTAIQHRNTWKCIWPVGMQVRGNNCQALGIQVYVNGHSSHRCVVATAKKEGCLCI